MEKQQEQLVTQKIAILIGVGEMGAVFARGLLKTGYTVIPILRDTDINQVASRYTDPDLVVVAVAENDCQSVLAKLPTNWSQKSVLLQNELLPNDWQKNNIQNPTVISVWFEKKSGQDFKVLISSPCYGPNAASIKTALNSLGIDCHLLKNEQELLFELVVKNVYILTTNIAGLQVAGNVEQLWSNHQDLARTIAFEIIDIQEYLCQTKFNRDLLLDAIVTAIQGDLEHKCMGRSAPARLKRVLDIAKQANLESSQLQAIAAQMK